MNWSHAPKAKIEGKYTNNFHQSVQKQQQGGGSEIDVGDDLNVCMLKLFHAKFSDNKSYESGGIDFSRCHMTKRSWGFNGGSLSR